MQHQPAVGIVSTIVATWRSARQSARLWPIDGAAGQGSADAYAPGARSAGSPSGRAAASRATPLYTPEQRRRRDATAWTLVQGILAPVQFAVFLVSLALVVRYLATGAGFTAAAGSVVVKTLALYAIMLTGSAWEKAVFGRWLFAPAFFWEDVVSMLVLALHTAYLAALWTGALDPRATMLLALAAYASYVVNAAQFVLKLRAARRQAARPVEAVPARAAPRPMTARA